MCVPGDVKTLCEMRPPQSRLMMRRRVAILTLSIVCVSVAARAQSGSTGATQDSGAPDPQPTWSFRVSAATYFVPNDEDYVQPTLAIDRGVLHLEGRYNYEGRQSVSGFIGWNVEFGKTVTVQLTPMLGAVGGDTDGVIPALEFDLAWKRLEIYVEGEYVIDIDRFADRFLYNWSEVSIWATEWLRAGLVTQRTRVHRTPLDIERGLLVGLTMSGVEPVLYFFNPGSDHRFFVASVGVEF
jgi:hypothetical protein